MMMNRREIIDELKEIVADMAAKEPHKRDWFDALSAFIELLEEQEQR